MTNEHVWAELDGHMADDVPRASELFEAAIAPLLNQEFWGRH